MLDEELRTLTASEPLTLEEEYEMQEKWQLDEDKLTFIILSRHLDSGPVQLPERPAKISPTDEHVNIFLHGTIPSLSKSVPSPAIAFHAEVEIMIAEPSFRRNGLAIEALRLMLGYATGQPQAFYPDSDSTAKTVALGAEPSPLSIPPESLLTRIAETNYPSIRLFEKLGFEITKRVEVFQEIEMRFRWHPDSGYGQEIRNHR
ncbi:hypothetical protein CPB84DRAFT_1781201 [Gymnopilus junonius]|uniref:N-acetyltransferase domain-containing protein n=1 Tax=Gymnopilus junonius TaxID=109634 RepID=A0A9P5TN11_GYMJU|nr:hypothetical protein CPB84DRAFT_1781201 [Gymnopilus junonius]